MSISLKLSAKPLDLPLKLVTRRLATNDSIGTAAWRNVSAAGSKIARRNTVIGLVSEWLGCAVEDLAIVVLTHELAHAYTQLGADIEGLRWAAPSNPGTWSSFPPAPGSGKPDWLRLPRLCRAWQSRMLSENIIAVAEE